MRVGAGQGNGSGGAKGIKGIVASADFGNGIANGGKGDGRSNGAGVSTGGFGSEQVVHGGPKIAQADAGGQTTPIEITFKPNPVYTDEARSLKLEGEVLLEVSFGANGTLHVNRVVRPRAPGEATPPGGESTGAGAVHSATSRAASGRDARSYDHGSGGKPVH